MEEPVRFSVKVTEKDMYTFLLRHNFTSFGGWFGVVFGVALLVLAGVTFKSVSTEYTVLYVLIGLLVLVYPFFHLRTRAKRQAASDSLKDMLDYEATGETMAVSLGEERQEFSWKEIRKVVETKRLLIVYINTVRAFVWPKEQIGEKLPDLRKLLIKALKKEQNGLKNKKWN